MQSRQKTDQMTKIRLRKRTAQMRTPASNKLRLLHQKYLNANLTKVTLALTK